MPPVRTATTTHKLAQRTERSHEENQERAYIAASRRSDRSLEARVESARRASEIHKKRTGRALRVREEDVLNEEMYEEEDDELSQQMRRMNALHPGFTSFSDRLNSYMAGHLGIRSALQQAIMQANQYNSQQLLNPMMQANGMVSPQSANNQFNSVPQSPWSFTHLPGNRPNFHSRSASIATPQELSNYQNSPINGNGRRTSLPGQNVPAHGLQSPSLSHPGSASSSNPSSPHGLYPSQPTTSPFQVPTPPQSNRSMASSGTKSHSATPTARPSYSQSPNLQIAPLTTKLPMETQQLFDGSQQTFNQTFFPGQIPSDHDHSSRVSYSYHPNGKPKQYTGSLDSNTSSPAGGLDQTLSPATFDQKYSASFSEPYSTAYASADMTIADSQDPFHDLGIVSGSDLTFDYDHADFGSGSDVNTYHSGSITPGLGGEPTWDPDDFLNFGASE